MSYNNSKTLTWLFFILQRSDKCQIYNWSSQTCSLTRRLFSQLVVTVLWITNIQAYMPCKSSENPTNQPHSAMGSPLHTYGPHRPPDVSLDPLEPLNIPLDLIGPLRSPVVPYCSSEDPPSMIMIYHHVILPLDFCTVYPRCSSGILYFYVELSANVSRTKFASGLTGS